MAAATHAMAFLVAAICIIFGLIDLAEQYMLGEELQWRVPMIFIGIGVGVSLFLILKPDIFESSDTVGDQDWGGYDGDDGGDGD